MDHYGPICQVCGVDFGERYGEIGEGFFHVHHVEALADVRRGHEVNRVKHRRPVCPNCHVMLHQPKASYRR